MTNGNTILTEFINNIVTHPSTTEFTTVNFS